MLNWTLVFLLTVTLVSCLETVGPKHPPTHGQVWPKPQRETKEELYYTFDPSKFQVKVTGENCTLLADAIERYSNFVFQIPYDISERYRQEPSAVPNVVLVRSISNDEDITPPQENKHQGKLAVLEVDLTAPCEEYPYLGMDESYNLTVSATSKITSASIWGILRGLESFAQLIYISDDFAEVRVNKTQIVDYPRHTHRGLLLDTSRHFISLNKIFIMLDAMSMNKMNVFHWHIVDDQSFPYESEKFPDLSGRGAYHRSMVYKKSDIQNVIEFARNRGIRVIPEFDVPGHTLSWGVAFPNILTQCYSGGNVIGLGPMNPIKNTTYKLIHELFEEVQDLFPEKYFHVGGDEVELSCWSSNPELKDYMKEHKIGVSDLHSLFMRNIMPFFTNKSSPIVWEEVFTEGVPLTKETLVHIWKGNTPSYVMVNALRQGYRVLNSAGWYLSHLDKSFENFYAIDPRQMVADITENDTLAEGVVGGEACMWAEMVDDHNVLSRVWPQASAVAEALWSTPARRPGRTWPYYGAAPVTEVTLRRAEEHTCRMVRRGVPAQPLSGPGFCLTL